MLSEDLKTLLIAASYILFIELLQVPSRCILLFPDIEQALLYYFLTANEHLTTFNYFIMQASELQSRQFPLASSLSRFGLMMNVHMFQREVPYKSHDYIA
jgi:hypothetical protein